ncbi:MAG TPA: HNH endonuclease [Thermoanaerobaculia bacterium]|nr:HNH endonuclease [Thermoanaerobaculia bacterium]
MNPFLYPRVRHTRTQRPHRFSDYRRYKPFLRMEFSRQCVYCRLPDGLRGENAFGVDHYRPVSRFPELECEYANLFYACNSCNWRKGDFWPEPRQWAEGRLIPNPCDHRMAEHLRFERTRVSALTAAGLVTLEFLLLNQPDDVEYRDFLLRAIEHCLRFRRAVVQSLFDLDARLREAGATELHGLLADRALLVSDLESVDRDLERLTGSAVDASSQAI